MNQELRLMIVAGDPLARSALANIFEGLPDCDVAGLANPSTAVDYLAELEDEGTIDLLIWDWGWDSGGIQETEFPDIDIPILVLTSDVDQVNEIWSAGAKAIIHREGAGDLLASAAISAAQGLIVIDPMLAESLLPLPAEHEDILVEDLTPREMEVLQLLAEGLTNNGIARELTISSHTVKFHVNGILSKLNAQSRTEAVVRATRMGLLAL